MRPKLWTRARVAGLSVAVALAATPALATEETVSAELREMRETVLQLQSQVQNQQSQIEERSAAIRGAGLDERSSASALSAFLEKTDFSGSIATSYAYNFKATGGSGGGGQNVAGAMNPFHPDHNSFQLDEVWLTIARSTSDESPVGFGIDIVYGQLGEALGNTGVGGGNSFWLPQAYIEYATHGLTWTAGKFDTHIGYETTGAARNVNITRGFSRAAMQPISQIGAKVAGEIGGTEWMLGIVNGIAPNQFDVDGIKDVIWQLRNSNDGLSVAFNGQYGGDAEAFGGGPKDRALILDGVIEYAPDDDWVAWFNVTYNRVDVDRQGANGTAAFGTDLKDTKALALAVGARQALSARLGLGGRVEWARVKNDQKAVLGSGAHGLNVGGGGLASGAELFSITTTVDYLLVDGLSLKGEVQWQKILETEGVFGLPSTTHIFDGGKKNQSVLFLAQLVYGF